jgi:squalene-hopene/tetraprenyl-beta-curcumene cyclase
MKRAEDSLQSVQAAVERATIALASLQREDGHWCGELQGDSILCSEYLLMKFILGQERAPMSDGRDGWPVLRKIANGLRRQQCEDGTWGQYPGAKIDVSATVKAYLALKLMGDDPEAPHMQRARDAVRAAGGAERCNSFSNVYLACLGQISWRACPAIPPEIIHLPQWCYFNLSNVSAWSRTMILPLAIVWATKPTRRVPAHLGIDELFASGRDRHRLTFLHRPDQARDGLLSWTTAFRCVDSILKTMERVGAFPLRRVSLWRAMEWVVERSGHSNGAAGGLGAIFPPMVYIQIALKAMGYGREDIIVRRAERELDSFFIEEEDAIRVQPCFSPVWDTGIALYALTDCGLDESDESVGRAAGWLRAKQCDHRGDWVQSSPSHSARGSGGWSAQPRVLLSPTSQPPHLKGGGGEAAGWWFEYDNPWYPDVDDTAMVAMALRRAGGGENIRSAARGVAWILDMQNDDGGWAAFDRTRHRPILEKIPFADHNALQDPSCPDITGRVLECLAWHGFTADDPCVARAIDYIRARQEREGCWFGRWGVNYIYGTWQAVIGPIRCGVPRDAHWIQKAGAWMKSIQKQDGSFGESADSYDDPSLKGVGPSTASQTAWASMVLLEIFGPDDPDLARAIDWLVRTQLTEDEARDPEMNVDGDPAGSWRETEFTGTGFPRVFYLRYHMYRLYFPLMALARYARARNLPEGSTRRDAGSRGGRMRRKEELVNAQR